MDYVGYGKQLGQNVKLQIGDICSFTIKDKLYEGMIMYDEDVFSFVFEMEDDKFPCVVMSGADLDSIVKICNVGSTVRFDRFEFFRETYGKPL